MVNIIHERSEVSNVLICVDVGNTDIVLGIYKEDDLISTFRLQTKIMRTEDEYGQKLHYNLNYLNIKREEVTGVIISSVVPEVDSTLETTFKKYFNITPLFVGPGVKTGIQVKIDNPKQLGADLLVGAVAATNKYGAPCLIIDMGTAITFSLVNSRKEFLGGIIYPGIATAYSNLVKSTSLLESAKISEPKNVIGKDTENSIQSGMIYGTSGAVNGLIKKVFSEYGEMKILVTGGTSEYIIPHLDYKVIYDENLMMEGLRIIYYKNKK